MKKRRVTLVAIGVVCGCVLAGGVALATFGSGGVIQGCYDNGGNLKVVNALPCPKGYTGLSWSQTGIPGAPGKDGVSGYEIVTHATDLSAAISAAGGDIVSCPTGKRALGGGASLLDSRGGATTSWKITQSYPTADGSGWNIDFEIPNGSNPFHDLHLTTYAICASMAS